MQYRVFLATVGVALTLAYPQQAVAQARQINIDDVLEAVRKKHDLPALAAAVILRGEIVATGAVGVRKIGADVPVTITAGLSPKTAPYHTPARTAGILPDLDRAAAQACSQLPSMLLARCARN